MTKTEIIAELRRSATDDYDPLCDVGQRAFYVANQWRGECMGYTYSAHDERMFFLLVACALEAE